MRLSRPDRDGCRVRRSGRRQTEDGENAHRHRGINPRGGQRAQRWSDLAIAPHRPFVLVGGDGDEACIERLIETARREYEASPRNVSPGLYTVDAGGAVVPLVLPGDHRPASEVALGHVLLASTEYEAQQQCLQQKYGIDPPRWRTARWPDPEILAELEGDAIA
jgi:hypothetical protein